jgi:glycosyltransferase involved in cell wall biosynthesis
MCGARRSNQCVVRGGVMPKITAVVMCYNDEHFVYPCLQQILPLADQTIIWDGDFWIGPTDPGRHDVLTQASSDNSRDMIDRAVRDFGSQSDVELAYFDGMPKMSEAAARNITLQMATGDYLLIVDCDELWSSGSMARLRYYIEALPDVPDFSIRNRLYFWNPYFYVFTKHTRLFKLWAGREFKGANEVSGSEGEPLIIPVNIDYEKKEIVTSMESVFNHYGYLDPNAVKAKMKWYDHGQWRGTGTWWYENIYLAFDGTLEGARELFRKNYGTIHPWGKRYPGFHHEEFTILMDVNPAHPAAIRQYFHRMKFDVSRVNFE